jgi:hypothetical protein
MSPGFDEGDHALPLAKQVLGMKQGQNLVGLAPALYGVPPKQVRRTLLCQRTVNA